VKPAQLIVQEPDGNTWTFEVTGPETLIGRSPAHHLQLADKAVSRDHAAISWEDDGYMIEDLQTTNGTKVNGTRVRSSPLKHGDTIQIGKTLITLELG
jgi:pSer/pThr/pTyr-binding forkhead associated (FHA) protein